MNDHEYENMIISSAGPGINPGFASLFLVSLALFSTTGLLLILTLFGFRLNEILSAFNMVPIPPFVGYNVF